MADRHSASSAEPRPPGERARKELVSATSWSRAEAEEANKKEKEERSWDYSLRVDRMRGGKKDSKVK